MPDLQPSPKPGSRQVGWSPMRLDGFPKTGGSGGARSRMNQRANLSKTFENPEVLSQMHLPASEPSVMKCHETPSRCADCAEDSRGDSAGVYFPCHATFGLFGSPRSNVGAVDSGTTRFSGSAQGSRIDAGEISVQACGSTALSGAGARSGNLLHSPIQRWADFRHRFRAVREIRRPRVQTTP